MNKIIYKERFDAINLFRLIATIVVFSTHVTLFSGLSMFEHHSWTAIFYNGKPAIWSFYVLSGYLAGKGFFNGRYSTDLPGIKKFYLKKLTGLYIPTVFFIFLLLVLCFSDFAVNNKIFYLKVLTCTYNGTPGVNGIGATWYVFAACWLYILSPVFVKIFRLNSEGKTKKIILLFVLMIFGLAYRMIIMQKDLDFYKWAYTSVPGNFDLFFFGLVASFLPKSERTNQRSLWAVSILAILCIHIYTTYMFVHGHNFVYYCIYPTIYMILGSFYLHEAERDHSNDKESKELYVFRIINLLSSISFEFYLFHSLVLDRISGYIEFGDGVLDYLMTYIITGSITIVLSLGYHRIFGRKITKNTIRLE